VKPENKHILRWLGLVLLLPIAGPYLYKTLIFPPPPRPSTVPADAFPLRADTEPDQRYSEEWWWAELTAG
jgi:hypothetical protein